MKILVTGGLGTVGAGLARLLTEHGHEIVSCDLFHHFDQYAYSIESEKGRYTYVRCDIGKYRQLARVFAEHGPFDYVYNCAAEFGRWNGEDYYEQLWNTNVIGTKHLLRLQEEMRFRLIHFSSSEVYGDWPELMVETVMDQYAIRQMNDYAMTKWTNEMQVRNSATQFGTETVIIRLFNTYGPGEHYSPYRSVNCRFLYSALKARPWMVYRGHQRTSTFLPDAVRTLANILDNFIPGEVYNIGGEYFHTIEELSELVLEVSGADQDLVSYRDSEILTTRTKKVDFSKAKKDLGHQCTFSLRDGLGVTFDWMKTVYAVDSDGIKIP